VATLLLAGAWACTSAQGENAASPAAQATQQRARPATEGQQVRPAPDHAWVIFGGDTVVAEVARTPEDRERGLMYRQELPDGTGMLFVFEDLGVRSFWMENTYVPLDIAFMDASYVVLNVEQMAALTTDSHDSAGPAMFALEVPQGWCAAHGVKRGDRATVVYGAQLKK
jgi:hypothetical protein